MIFLYFCVVFLAFGEERHALLIGNSIDPHYMLPEAEENITVLANILRAQNFSVVSISNGSQAEMEASIQAFVAQDSDLSIFYYMGHGGQRNGENFFRTQRGLWVEAKPLFQERSGKHLVLFDANRTSPTEQIKGWGIPKKLPDNIMLSLATAPGMTEYARPRFMSLYVEELSIWLPRAAISLSDVLKNVHRSIKKRTDNQQIPVLMGVLDDVVVSNASKQEDLNITVQRVRVFPFTMGCTSAHSRVCADDERPAHQVSLRLGHHCHHECDRCGLACVDKFLRR